MPIIPRYLLFNFCRTFCLWFVCIVGLYIIFDLFTNLESVFGGDGSTGEVLQRVATYYFFKSLPFFDMIAGLLATISVMITIVMMIRHNELVALQAAGISDRRIVRPILIAAFVFITATVVLREVVFPHWQRELMMTPQTLIAGNGLPMNSATDMKTRITLNGNETFRHEKRISSPKFGLPPELRKTCGQFLLAENAFHLDKNMEHPAGYLLKKVSRPADIAKLDNQFVGDQLAVITSQEAKWLEPNECLVVSEIPFDYIVSNQGWRSFSSVWELVTTLHSQCLDLGEDVMIGVHQRILQPFLDATLLFLGIPIILRAKNQKLFHGIATAGLLVLGFFCFTKISQNIGASFGTPILGTWFPLMIFAPMAHYLSLGMD